MSARPVPCGSWRSPLAAADLAAGSLRFGDLACDGGDVLWVEGRPAEGGRSVLVRRGADGEARDVLDPPWSARTRVHEYGGGAFAADAGVVWFSNLADQRIWRVDPGREPRAVTPDDGRRWADAAVDAARRRLVAVCEEPREDAEPVNRLAAVSWDGGAPPRTLSEGHDFYASPRLSPDGERLAWLAWDHPDMPWDSTTLYVARVAADGGLRDPQRVAGGDGISVFQPGWSPAGDLYFVSDETGWWNLRRLRGGRVESPCPREAEFGLPQWVFGMSTWAALGDGRLACAFRESGAWRLGILEPDSGALEIPNLPYTSIAGVNAAAGGLVFAAGSPGEAESIVHLDVASGKRRVLRSGGDLALDPAFVSVPEAISFPTDCGETAHGHFYRPTHRDCRVPGGERPPLLVKIHGGPTGAASGVFDPRIQFWTSRGFAVLDVDYRGSTGYGRAYRDRLRGAWGRADVTDCERGALHLVERGDVDPARLAITGGSAGGYTALCALTFGDVFAAGASYYGVVDLEALARDTHKFEARYLDRLVGPYPEARELYRERSPIHHADRLARPVIFFQGLDDPIVPPAQSEAMVEVLRGKGLPVAYVPFEGESHGFRQGRNIARALEAELAFYGAVFGFEPADPIEPIPLENL